MKFVKLMMVLALCLAAKVAAASVYDYDIDTPSAYSSQEEVIVGEGEMMDAPMMENYGPMPSWNGGCCERVPSKADCIWNDYCCQKHRGCCQQSCCGKAFCGCGGCQKGCCTKGCCKSKCGRGFHLPKLNLFGRCCQKAKCCKQKACCKATKCCKGISLPKFRLFRGCCKSKCGKCCKGGKGYSVGSPVIEAPADEVPAPMIDSDLPPSPPMIDQAT